MTDLFINYGLFLIVSIGMFIIISLLYLSMEGMRRKKLSTFFLKEETLAFVRLQSVTHKYKQLFVLFYSMYFFRAKIQQNCGSSLMELYMRSFLIFKNKFLNWIRR